MREALDFALRVFLRQGIWIAGAAWLFAVGGWAIFARADGAKKSCEDSLDIVKRKIIWGVVVLIVGIVIAI
jgi:cell division protein FtsX